MERLLLLGVLALLAGHQALTRQRTPNWLTMGGTVAALTVALAVHGWAGVSASLLGWGAGVVALTPLALLGLAGPADLKLAGALGAAAAWQAVGNLGFFMAATALGLALVQAVRAGTIRTLGTWSYTAVGLIRLGGAWREHLLAPAKGRFPLSLVMAGGALLYVVAALLLM